MVAPVNVDGAVKTGIGISIECAVVINSPVNHGKLVGLRLYKEVPLAVTALLVGSAVEVGWSEMVGGVMSSINHIADRNSLEAWVHTAELGAIEGKIHIKKPNQVTGSHALAGFNLYPVALVVIPILKNFTIAGLHSCEVDVAITIHALVVIVIIALGKESALHTAVPHTTQSEGSRIVVRLILNNIGIVTNAVEQTEIIIASTILPF